MWVYTLLPRILNMSLTASIVIVCVLLARGLLKKAPKIFSYALWAVVLFRLVCPVSFSSELSLIALIHRPAVIHGSLTYIPADIVHTEFPRVDLPLPIVSKAINDALPRGEEQLVADPLEGQMAAATLLWLFGVAAMLVYSAFSLLSLRRRLVGAVRLRDNVFLADHIATPFVIGLIRPKIYLPSALTGPEQDYILLHERTHIRRLDHIFKMIAFLALAVHWFNPLVWVAFLCCVKNMEMSCDEGVLKEMGGGIKRAYSSSLLSLAAGRIIGGSPLAFGEGSIKSRIRNVLNFKKPSAWVVVASILLTVGLSVGFAANRAPQEPSPAAAQATGQPVPTIESTPNGAMTAPAYSDAAQDLLSEQERLKDSLNSALGPEATAVSRTLEPATPTLSPEQDIGVDMAFLDYASDDTVIFHGFFGLVVYDLNAERIVRSLNLRPIGCEATQGDNYSGVSVSMDGNTVQLCHGPLDNMYVYTPSDNTLRETAYARMKNRFANFVEITDAIGHQKKGYHSFRAVPFDTGDYGYLRTSDWTLGTLTYVRGKRTYQLFASAFED